MGVQRSRPSHFRRSGTLRGHRNFGPQSPDRVRVFLAAAEGESPTMAPCLGFVRGWRRSDRGGGLVAGVGLMSIVMGVSAVAAAGWRSLWLFVRRRVSVRGAVIAGCAMIAALVVRVSVAPEPAADFVRRYIFPISLMRGWLPASVQVFTAVLLVCAVGWRTRRWRLGWLPVTLVVGVVLAAGARWDVESAGGAEVPVTPNVPDRRK